MDPGELLMDLGFGGAPSSAFSRIPSRFFTSKSNVSHFQNIFLYIYGFLILAWFTKGFFEKLLVLLGFVIVKARHF